MTLYKVLGPNSESIHGGSLQWSLPQKRDGVWTPGDWHRVEGTIRCRQNGLHLTTSPWQDWVKWESNLYIAEGHAKARWRVWEKGYGCATAVDGKLYVYKRIS